MTQFDRAPSGPDPIEAESYRILRSRIDLTHLPPLTRAVTERVIHASADFDYATDLICDESALAAGVAAITRGAPVVTDVAMVAAGITGYPVICKIGDSIAARLARTVGITVSAAATRLAFGEAGPGAVWVVGCAPTALEEILRRDVVPALVIGLPVGFVGAAAAKEALRASGLPAISNVSEKGGSAVAAAAFNALLRVARTQATQCAPGRQAAASRAAPAGDGRPMRPALLMAGHGTRDPEGVAGFVALAKRLTARAETAVRPARRLPGGRRSGRTAASRRTARRRPDRRGRRLHRAVRAAAPRRRLRTGGSAATGPSSPFR